MSCTVHGRLDPAMSISEKANAVQTYHRLFWLRWFLNWGLLFSGVSSQQEQLPRTLELQEPYSSTLSAEPSLDLALCFETGSLVAPESTLSIRLAGQWAPEICLFILPKIQGHKNVPLCPIFLIGALRIEFRSSYLGSKWNIYLIILYE